MKTLPSVLSCVIVVIGACSDERPLNADPAPIPSRNGDATGTAAGAPATRRDPAQPAAESGASGDGRATEPSGSDPVEMRDARTTSSDYARFEPSRFADPPLEFAPGLRWGWPGSAVDDATIEQQVQLLAAAGYGTLEVQPMRVGMTDEELRADPRILTVGEPEYLARLKAAAHAARKLGLGFDVTLGSGWPNGGLGVPKTAAEEQLIFERIDVTGPTKLDMPLPAATEPDWKQKSSEILPGLVVAGAFDTQVELEGVVAAPLVDARAEPPVLGTVVDITDRVSQGRLQWDAPAGPYVVFVLYRNRTTHAVVGAVFPGKPEDAQVIDHLGPEGVRWLIDHQLDPWMKELGDAKPDYFFIDSFELIGQLPWSRTLRKRYDAYAGHPAPADVPFMLHYGGEAKYVAIQIEAAPEFASSEPERVDRVREDYERVRAEVFSTEYLKPLLAAARERGVGLRIQAHGGWGVLLDDYARSDSPEAESLFAGGSFDFLTLAASAGHVAGTRLISSESFVTSNLFPGTLDPEALWLLAGLAYSAGITRLVHSAHTYPYTLPDGRKWLWADPNPTVIGGFTSEIQPASEEWSFLPEFNRAQARIGYALTRGTPRTDVAWLKADREVRDTLQLAIGSANVYAPESEDSIALRAAGYTYDRISPSALAAATAERGLLQVGAARYRALVVDAEVIDPELLEAIDALEQAGVPIVWSGTGPRRAYGLRDAALRDARVAELWAALRERVERPGSAGVPAGLRAEGVLPDIEAPGLLGTIGIVQRDTEDGRVVWLFNESPLPQLVAAKFNTPVTSVQAFDPETGRERDAVVARAASDITITLTLAGARGAVLFLPK